MNIPLFNSFHAQDLFCAPWVKWSKQVCLLTVVCNLACNFLISTRFSVYMCGKLGPSTLRQHQYVCLVILTFWPSMTVVEHRVHKRIMSLTIPYHATWPRNFTDFFQVESDVCDLLFFILSVLLPLLVIWCSHTGV